MKILILGLNSQISKTIHKKIGTKKMKKYDFLFLDRKYMNKKSLSTEIKKYKPNTIINTTVFHPVDDCEKYINKSKKINVLLIKDLINIFKYQKINPLFIHISSDYVFEGNPKKLAYTDNAYRNPINVLGNHKKQSEDLILKYYGRLTPKTSTGYTRKTPKTSVSGYSPKTPKTSTGYVRKTPA